MTRREEVRAGAAMWTADLAATWAMWRRRPVLPLIGVVVAVLLGRWQPSEIGEFR